MGFENEFLMFCEFCALHLKKYVPAMVSTEDKILYYIPTRLIYPYTNGTYNMYTFSSYIGILQFHAFEIYWVDCDYMITIVIHYCWMYHIFRAHGE